MIDIAGIEGKLATKVLDPRLSRRRPARVHDLTRVPDPEALVPLLQPAPDDGRLEVGTEAAEVLEVGRGQKRDPYRHPRDDLRKLPIKSALQHHDAAIGDLAENLEPQVDWSPLADCPERTNDPAGAAFRVGHHRWREF